MAQSSADGGTPRKRTRSDQPASPGWQCIVFRSPNKPPPTRQDVATQLGITTADWSAESDDFVAAPFAPGQWVIKDRGWAARRRGRSSSAQSPSKRARLETSAPATAEGSMPSTSRLLPHSPPLLSTASTDATPSLHLFNSPTPATAPAPTSTTASATPTSAATPASADIAITSEQALALVASAASSAALASRLAAAGAKSAGEAVKSAREATEARAEAAKTARKATEARAEAAKSASEATEARAEAAKSAREATEARAEAAKSAREATEAADENVSLKERVESLEEWRFEVDYGNCWGGFRKVLQRLFETKVTAYINNNFQMLKAQGLLTQNPNSYAKNLKLGVDKYPGKVDELRRKSTLDPADTVKIEVWQLVQQHDLARLEVTLMLSFTAIAEKASQKRDSSVHQKTTKSEFDKWIRPAIRSELLPDDKIDSLWTSLKEVKVDVVGRKEQQAVFED